MPNITLTTLQGMKQSGEKIAMLTCYDATFTHTACQAGVDVLLVGDSLGMVLQGNDSTLPVSIEDMVYHTRAVKRGNSNALILSDMPFMAYASIEQTYASCAALMQAGAHMVKLEGGGWTAPTVEFLVQRGVPVCAHLGLTPQTVHALGGYRVQGKTEDAARTLRKEALELQNAGAAMLVLEMVPAALAAEITAELPHCHTIGIGAGNGTAGQVLVLHDMLGVNLGKMARFVHNFMQDAGSVRGAMEAYVQAVKQGRFPDNTLHAW